MSLRVTENQGTYYVKGNINSTNLVFFNGYFESIFNNVNFATINIEEVKEIDIEGLTAIGSIINRFINNGKKLYIAGNGCKDIYDHFSETQIA